jgi:hypothetical protein
MKQLRYSLRTLITAHLTALLCQTIQLGTGELAVNAKLRIKHNEVAVA